MKLPITKLAVLLSLLGGPLGLMQYDSRAAFIDPPARPLLNASPESQLTWSCVDELLSDLMASKTTALDFSMGYVAKLDSYYEAQRAKWFAPLHDSAETPGLIDATKNAVANSWTAWRPTLVALPEQLAELCHGELHNVWRGRKAWCGRLEAYAMAHMKAAEQADVAAIRSFANAFGGSVADRLAAIVDDCGLLAQRAGVPTRGAIRPHFWPVSLGEFCDSCLPKWFAAQLKPTPIPGLLAATAKAIGKGGTKWPPTLVVAGRVNELRMQDIFANWQRRFKRYTKAQLEASALARALPHYETDHAEASEPVIVGEPVAVIASRSPWVTAEKVGPFRRKGPPPMENMRILRSRWASGTYLRRLFQQPPLPTAATVALGAITCDLGIVASVPLGRAVLDFVSGLQNPTFRIAKFGEPTLWRPALLRAIDSFGQSGVHNR